MSDLDNEEIEATRLLKNINEKELDELIKSTEGSIEETCKFLKDNSFIEYKEKSADEMFEELGFKKVIDNEKEVKYQYKNTIMGDRIEHTIQIAKIGKIIFSYRDDTNHQVMGFSKDELQAINKKCKELRMDMRTKKDEIILDELCKKEIDENIKLKEKIEQIKKEIINFDNSCKKTLKTYDTLNNDNFRSAYEIIKKIENYLKEGEIDE